MKFLSVLALGLLLSLSTIGQFKDLVVVEIDNKGKVPGKTFQVYVELTNDSDHVHIIFGDETSELYLRSTKPFYQNELAGALSSNLNPQIEANFDEAKFDTYLTIGRTNSKNNFISNFNMDLEAFESKGANISTINGAWYVTPDNGQAYCSKGDKHVLIMQLTSEGEIEANISLQGKDHYQDVWREIDHKFSSNEAISEKEFLKMRKANVKAFKKK
ncbi:MAG: hypothetical protein AB8B53_13650 [Flavobacteriales bacterium]